MDSDEEAEMRALRASGRHVGRGPKPQVEEDEEDIEPLPKAPGQDVGDDGSDADSSEPVKITKPGFSGASIGPRKPLGPSRPTGSVSLGPPKPSIGPAKPSMGPAKPSMGPARPAVNIVQNESDDEGDEGDDDDDDQDDVRTAFPMSFGRAAPEKLDAVKIHAEARRRKEEKEEKRNLAKLQEKELERTRKMNLGVEDSNGSSDPLPLAPGAAGAAEEVSDDDEEEDDVLPFSHETTIDAHPKSCQAMAIDSSGTRMVTGSLSGDCHMFDFGGMTQEAKYFRELEPSQGHPVHAISWQCTSKIFCVANGDVHIRLFDREGSKEPMITTVRGDMYVRDMANTKGHTQEVNDVMWHPTKKNNWISAGQDGTVRIWDVTAKLINIQQHLPQMHVLKCVDKRNVCTGGSGVAPTCCMYHPDDGKKIVAGCTDGSLQLFHEKARYTKADTIVRTAHNDCITSVAFSGNYLFSRGMDDSLRQWDMRKFSTNAKPVRTWGDLPNICPRTGTTISPDGSYVCTARSAPSKDGNGGVSVFNILDGERIRDIELGKGHTLKVDWHKELNQLLASTTTGNVHVLYNPQKSTKGALLFMSRHKSKKNMEEAVTATGPIFNMVDGKGWKEIRKYGDGDLYKMRKKEKRAAQKNPLPKQPTTGDADYREQKKSTSLAQHVMGQLGKNTIMKENARDELLKYSDRDDMGSFVNSAYSSTQPQNVLDHTNHELEGDKLMAPKKICPMCGMKMCKCGYMAKMEMEENTAKRQRTA
eukprot:gene353-707_t